MSIHTRLAKVLDRLSTASSVQRTRDADAARAERNGDVVARNERLEEVVTRLEAAADELWMTLEPDESKLKAVS